MPITQQTRQAKKRQWNTINQRQGLQMESRCLNTKGTEASQSRGENEVMSVPQPIFSLPSRPLSVIIPLTRPQCQPLKISCCNAPALQLQLFCWQMLWQWRQGWPRTSAAPNPSTIKTLGNLPSPSDDEGPTGSKPRLDSRIPPMPPRTRILDSCCLVWMTPWAEASYTMTLSENLLDNVQD